jgi:hypothetical protein
VHEAVAARSAEATELFEEFRVPKAQEGQRFYTHRRGLKSWSSQRGKGAKVEAFRFWKFFQVLEESAEAQEGAQLPLDEPIDSGPLKFLCPGSSRRSAQEEEIVSRRISLRYPSVVGSDRSYVKFKPS